MAIESGPKWRCRRAAQADRTGALQARHQRGFHPPALSARAGLSYGSDPPMSTSPGSRHIFVPTEAATDAGTPAELASEQFSAQRTPEARGVVVRLSGELDLGSASELERLLSEILAEPEAGHSEQHNDRVLLDLSGLDFMDSTGIKVLVAAKQLADAHGRQLAVCDPKPQVHRLLEVVGLLDRLMLDQ